MKRLFASMLLLAAALFAADPEPAYIPNSTTAVAKYTVRIKTLYLANKTASAATVTLKDRSTNCGGAACQVWPAVSIPANSVYVADLRNIRVISGFTWESDTASAVVGWVEYN